MIPPMTDDLVGRLLNFKSLHRDAATLFKAADTIRDQAARIEALEGALRAILHLNKARTWTATHDNPESHWVEHDGPYAEIARAALTPEAPHAD